MLTTILIASALNIVTPKTLTWEVQIADQKFSTSNQDVGLSDLKTEFLSCDLTVAKVTRAEKSDAQLHERSLICGLQDVPYVIGIPLSCATDQQNRQEVTVAIMLKGKMIPITLSCEAMGTRP